MKIKHLFYIFAASLFLGVLLAGQAPVKPLQLTELEQTQIQLFAYRIRDINHDMTEFTAKFEKDHPGWTVNLATGQVFQKPAEVKPEPKKP